MINDKKQQQESGDSSLNFQVAGDLKIENPNYLQIRQIVLDLFKANAIELSQIAAEESRKRVEEITDEFLKGLAERNPEKINELEKPDMQYALFAAQREYAKTGDKDLEELLVDILIDRASEPTRNLKQIVLDESLEIAPKLPFDQLDTLSLIFILTRTKNNKISNLPSFVDYLQKYICPFVENLSNEVSHYEHLIYSRCCSSMSISYNDLENVFVTRYPALFFKGFTKEEFNEKVADNLELNNLLIPCFHNPTLYQFSAMNEEILDFQISENKIDDSIASKVKSLFKSQTMSNSDARAYILREVPEMEKVFDIFNNSKMKSMELTSVGIAVAQANFRRKTGLTYDLGIWIK